MNVGSVGDIHLPFVHPAYMEFCYDVFSAWKVDHIHFAGDIVDNHALGFWDIDPNGLSSETESAEAAKMLKRWVRRFPTATVAIGNHDERHFRKARAAGIPDKFMKGYAEIWGTPKWKWEMSHVLDGVLYEHGTGTSGIDGAMRRAMQKRCSLVMGHIHSWAGVKFNANDFNRIFGLNVGCGIDIDQYAFAYGKPFPVRPVLGCGIVVDGIYPHFVPMPCGKREKYHKPKFKAKR